MRLLRAAVVLLVAALVLGGCGDDEPDPGDPGSTWTPTSKPETPTSEPVDPLTEAPEGETAQEFIRRWVALSNRMQETGETEAFLAVAGPDCRSCRDLADNVTEIYGNGGSIKTDGSRVTKLHHDGGDQWTASLVGAPTVVLAADGTQTNSLDGGPYDLLLFVARVRGAWVVGEFQDKS